MSNQIMERIDVLALHTEQKGCMTRTYLTAAHRGAAGQIAAWARDAGMVVRRDARFCWKKVSHSASSPRSPALRAMGWNWKVLPVMPARCRCRRGMTLLCMAGAEIALFIEKRCNASPGLVGTVGQFIVPNGAGNVIPGHAVMSIDIRAGEDAQPAVRRWSRRHGDRIDRANRDAVRSLRQRRIGHNPAETMTAEDVALASRVFADFVETSQVPAAGPA